MDRYTGILTGAALFSGAFLLCSEYEKKHAVLTEYDVTSDALPAGFEGTRILFLSDLHNNHLGKENGKLIRMIREAQPDMILFGGDMITAKKWSRRDFSGLEELLRAFDGRIPMYYGNGNHESRIRSDRETYPGWYPAFKTLLKTYHVRHLMNDTVIIEKGEERIRISGIDFTKRCYLAGRKRPLEADYIEKRLGPRDGDYHIVLAHSPLYLQEFSDWGADLVLSGHFHGGTIRLPLGGGVMTPQFQFFNPYCRGLHMEGPTTLIVSGGLGTHSINVRIMNRPEAILIRLHRKEPL